MRRDPLFAMVALVAGLTSLSLGVSGEAPLVSLAVPAAALYALARPIRSPRGRAFEWGFQLLALGFLGWFLFSLTRGRLLAGAVALTVPAHLYQLLQPPSHQTIKLLQLVSAFQLVALAAATTRILFGPLLAVHLALAPLMLTLAALERVEGEPRRPAPWSRAFVRPALLATLLVAVGGLVGFLALPRYEAGLFTQLSQPSQRMSGFSETVSLGDITGIQTSDRVVMRVKLRGEPPDDLRWRGIALDRFTGRTWSVTAPRPPEVVGGSDIEIGPPGQRSRTVVQEFSLEPLQPTALFHLARPVRVRPHEFPSIRVDAWGNLARTFTRSRRLSYEVESDIGADPTPLPADLRQACLQLPELDARIPGLARAAAGEGDELDRARRVAAFVRDRCAYSLDVRDVGVADPIGAFLFDTRKGHCEYFASATVVLLRSEGIPARVVNGFVPGQRSSMFGHYIVRQRHAHAWVEAHVAGRGWTMLDPTPPAGVPLPGGNEALALWERLEILWDDNVIGFNYTFQLGYVAMLRDAGRWIAARSSSIMAAGSLLVAVLAVVQVLRHRRRGRRAGARRGAPEWYLRGLRLMARRSRRRLPAETPLEYAREYGRVVPGPAAAAALELTRLYHAERHGLRPADPAEVARCLAALQRARRPPAPGRRGAGTAS